MKCDLSAALTSVQQAEWRVIYDTRLAILCPDGRINEQAKAMARKEADDAVRRMAD